PAKLENLHRIRHELAVLPSACPGAQRIEREPLARQGKHARDHRLQVVLRPHAAERKNSARKHPVGRKTARAGAVHQIDVSKLDAGKTLARGGDHCRCDVDADIAAAMFRLTKPIVEISLPAADVENVAGRDIADLRKYFEAGNLRGPAAP